MTLKEKQRGKSERERNVKRETETHEERQIETRENNSRAFRDAHAAHLCKRMCLSIAMSKMVEI